MRCFISVSIPEEIKLKISEIQNNLPDFTGKKTERENLHLTLKFLGEINEEKLKAVRDKLKKIKFKKFESQINSIGIFSENFIRIIWLHLTNSEELQKKIDDSLKEIFKPEERFMGHLTIARVKEIKTPKEFLRKLDQIKIPKLKFLIKSFSLIQSDLFPEGPKYTVLENYKLK